MLVKDFKASEGYRFPEAFLDSLPSVCLDDRCLSPTEMTEVLTSLRCSNPRCPTKIARRVMSLLNMMGVKELGGARADSFVSKFEVDNPLIIFAYVPEDDGELGERISIDISTRIYEQIKSKKSFTLAEYVRIANIPFIQTSAFSIFGDYDDLTEAYQAIEEGGVEFIRDKLNIKKGGKKSKFLSINSTEDIDDDLDLELEDVIEDISIRAIKVFESLMTFKDDLFFGVDYVNIIKVNTGEMKMLKAVCSEEVGPPYKTKADFYATVNNLYSDLHVEFSSSVTKAIDYLVWAGAEDDSVRVTNKVLKVRKYNEQYEAKKETSSLKDDDKYIPIVSAAQFLGILQEMVTE